MDCVVPIGNKKPTDLGITAKISGIISGECGSC